MPEKQGKLEQSYREGGWTARQIIHHLPDSHLNMYIRLKWTLTEVHPTIKPYNQDMWADLDEAKHGDIEVSLTLLEALHERVNRTLRKLNVIDFERTYFHPELQRNLTLDEMVQMYAWHGNHHVGQLKVIAAMLD